MEISKTNYDRFTTKGTLVFSIIEEDEAEISLIRNEFKSKIYGLHMYIHIRIDFQYCAAT